MRTGKAAAAVVFVLILALGSTAFASTVETNYRRHFDLDGDILMKIMFGDEGSDSGHHKTLVEGRGSLTRDEDITLGGNKKEIAGESSWTADPGYLRGLKVASSFFKPETDGEDGNEAEQVFAVSIEAEPGESGRLAQDISAAGEDEDGERSFAVEQYAFTSDGTVKRYIDLIDPASKEYIYEETTIEGYARIIDSLHKADNPVEGVSEPAEAEEKTAGSNPGSPQGEPGEILVVMDEGSPFAMLVPTGVPLEKITFPKSVDLVFDMMTIKDIEIEWSEDSSPAYDPEKEDTYIFEGELVFPDNIAADFEIFIYYMVHVIDEASLEEILVDRELETKETEENGENESREGEAEDKDGGKQEVDDEEGEGEKKPENGEAGKEDDL